MNYFWSIFPSSNGFEIITLLAVAVLKTTVLLSLIAGLCLVFRSFSVAAATRSLMWSLALLATLLLPLLSSTLNIWQLPILEESLLLANVLKVEKTRAEARSFSRESQGESVESYEQEDKSSSSVGLLPLAETSNSVSAPESTATARFLYGLVIIWASGTFLFLIKLLTGYIMSRRLARHAAIFKDDSWEVLLTNLVAEIKLKRKVKLFRSARALTPFTYGILRPIILLPEAGAGSWTEEEARRMVLLHELAHIKRWDCLSQMIAQIACAFYWFNPLFWYASARLKIEREYACDDYVLSLKARPSNYAQQLLEIARSINKRSKFDLSRTMTITMVQSSHLEGRLQSILDKNFKYRGISYSSAINTVAVICVLLFSLAVVQPVMHGGSGGVRQSLEVSAATIINSPQGNESSVDLSPFNDGKQNGKTAASRTNRQSLKTAKSNNKIPDYKSNGSPRQTEAEPPRVVQTQADNTPKSNLTEEPGQTGRALKIERNSLPPRDSDLMVKVGEKFAVMKVITFSRQIRLKAVGNPDPKTTTFKKPVF